MGQEIITELSDMVGYALEDVMAFFHYIIDPYVVMMGMFTVAFIIIIYFRFFRQAITIREFQP